MSTDSELAKSFNKDVVERYGRHFVELLCESLDGLEEPVRALDLACGTGFGTIPVLDVLPEGSTVVALSDDRFALKEFHKSLNPDLRERIFPHKESNKRLPFADATFDLVFACLPNRLWEPLRPVLREALRVLRIGGRFAATVPLNGSFLELQGAIGTSGQDDEHLAMQRMMAEITQLVDADEWIKMLERGGAGETEVKKSTFKLNVKTPPSGDHLVARHVLPLWLGESQSYETDDTLDAAITEPLDATVHVGCILAESVAEE